MTVAFLADVGRFLEATFRSAADPPSGALERCVAAVLGVTAVLADGDFTSAFGVMTILAGATFALGTSFALAFALAFALHQ